MLLLLGTPACGGTRGFDAYKRAKGRKRHILVDPLGLLLTLHFSSISSHSDSGKEICRCFFVNPSGYSDFGRSDLSSGSRP
jgi:hypothetical protein